MYVRKKDCNFLLLRVYVDDLAIAGTFKANLLQFVNDLQQAFPTKHLGELEYFLGLEVNCNRCISTLSVSQCKLVDNILHKYDMMACSLVDTPLIVPCHLSTSESPSTNEEVSFMQNIPYHHILRSLRYLVSCTLPDLSYSTGSLSRFMENPGPCHWEALKHVLHYLTYSSDMTLTYKALSSSSKRDMVVLQGWTNVD